MITTTMASAIFTSSYFCPPSLSKVRKSNPTFSSLCTSLNSIPTASNFCSSRWVTQLGLTPFSPCIGLRQQGISISHVILERRKKCKRKGVFASLFGVGAPEVLVIGVVALLVFGPKGLAEVARNLGKTLREFQPTIRQLQEVSREFKSTLEKEIGLDESQSPAKGNYSSNTISPTSRPSTGATSEDSQAKVDPNGSPTPDKAYSSEDYMKITEEQLKAVSAALQQKEETTSSLGESQFEPQTQSKDTVQEVAAELRLSQKPKSET